MTTHAVTCATCEQRFVVTADRKPVEPTCSAKCLSALYRRRINHRRLVAVPMAPMPSAPQPRHRAREALAETRAVVASLLAKGRRARLTSTAGDFS